MYEGSSKGKVEITGIKLAGWKSIGWLLVIFFFLGLVLGSCSLGMKVPGALFDLATGSR